VVGVLDFVVAHGVGEGDGAAGGVGVAVADDVVAVRGDGAAVARHGAFLRDPRPPLRRVHLARRRGQRQPRRARHPGVGPHRCFRTLFLLRCSSAVCYYTDVPIVLANISSQ
jgi:hypothetical protein